MAKTIAELERDSAELRERLSRIDAAIQALKAVSDSVWRVASRSGNRDHFVVVSGGNWSCHCDGAVNGRECWALRGVRYSLQSAPSLMRVGLITFYDDRGLQRYAYRITEYTG